VAGILLALALAYCEAVFIKEELHMLTDEQRKELEAHGAMNIRFKLLQHGAGSGGSISGFKCGDITRGDIEDWLMEQSKIEAEQQSETLRWARIAGWAGIIGVVLAAIRVIWEDLFGE
jgi:hypothetical protein